jgi:hypothetical protein
MIEIKQRSLTSADLSAEKLAKLDTSKTCVFSEWAGKGHWTLVHDGKHIIVFHGPEAATGTGNPAHKMLCGDEKELRDEIKRLGLSWPDEQRPKLTYQSGHKN